MELLLTPFTIADIIKGSSEKEINNRLDNFRLYDTIKVGKGKVMLSAAQFASQNKVGHTLPEGFDDFALFTIDLGEVTENGEVCNPHLTGKGVNLWDVTPMGELTIHQIKAMEDKEVELDRKARLELYTSRGWAFEQKSELEVEDDPSDEWDEWARFFADDVPMTGGKCRRRGGVKSNSAFEGFVDSAQ